MNIPKSIRIIIAGDSYVGKSSLLNLICEKKSKKANYTVGYGTDVLIYNFKDREYCIEFIDISGSQTYKLTRNLLYYPINGLILVHDLSNRHTYKNIGNWIEEIIGNDFYWTNIETNDISYSSPSSSSSSMDHTLEISGNKVDNRRIPTIIIGNKKDLVNENNSNYTNSFRLNDLSDSIKISSLDSDTFVSSTYEGDKISNFFDHCIRSRFFLDDYSSNNNNNNKNEIEITYNSPKTQNVGSPLRFDTPIMHINKQTPRRVRLRDQLLESPV